LDDNTNKVLKGECRPPPRPQGSRLRDCVIVNPGPMAGHPREFQDYQELVIFEAAQDRASISQLCRFTIYMANSLLRMRVTWGGIDVALEGYAPKKKKKSARDRGTTRCSMSRCKPWFCSGSQGLFFVVSVVTLLFLLQLSRKHVLMGLWDRIGIAPQLIARRLECGRACCIRCFPFSFAGQQQQMHKCNHFYEHGKVGGC
jgi:hypothetical protein